LNLSNKKLKHIGSAQTEYVMNFGQAIEALKQGKSVSRNGWNGKGMFIYLNKGGCSTHLADDETLDGISGSLFDLTGDGTVTRLPNLNMKSATGAIVTGWLASQTDILSEDWGVVEF